MMSQHVVRLGVCIRLAVTAIECGTAFHLATQVPFRTGMTTVSCAQGFICSEGRLDLVQACPQQAWRQLIATVRT